MYGIVLLGVLDIVRVQSCPWYFVLLFSRMTAKPKVVLSTTFAGLACLLCFKRIHNAGYSAKHTVFDT